MKRIFILVLFLTFLCSCTNNEENYNQNRVNGAENFEDSVSNQITSNDAEVNSEQENINDYSDHISNSQNTESSTTEQVSTGTSPIETEENASETTVLQREDADFRNAKWGDSLETVLEYETEIDLIEERDYLIGEANVGGYDAFAGYYFDNNKLYMTAYSFSQTLNYSNAGQYIPVYNSLKEGLITKYGSPTFDEIVPMESQDMIEYAGEVRALEFGYVVYMATWETETTDITIGMSAENYEINLVIIYRDKYYEPDINDSGL